MKNFFRVSWPYIKPYLHWAGVNVILNVFGIIFSLFSLTLIIPFLRILFKTQQLVTELMPWSFSMESIEHNLYYYLSQVIMERGEVQALIFVSILVVVMFFLKNLFIYGAKFVLVYLRGGVIRDLRNDLYRKILGLPIGYFTESRKGDTISRSSNDVTNIEVSIISSFEAFFLNLINIIVFVTALFIMSWSLTLFVLILLPVSATVIGLLGKSLRRSSLKAQTKIGDVMSILEETLSGLKIIKTLNAEGSMMNRFDKQNTRYMNIYNRVLRKRSLASPISEFLGAMVIVIIMWYGGSLVLGENTTLSPESFIAYLAIFSQLIEPGKKFSSAFYNVQKGLASFARVNDILQADLKIVSKKNAQPVSGFHDAIEYQKVNFRYGTEYVLKNINIKIPHGNTAALVGQSGSGKSTLVDLLPRFYDVHEGQVLIDGIPIKDIRLPDLRNLIGYVNQEPILFNDSFHNNIALGVKNATRADVIKAAMVANAHDFIMSTEEGYDTNIGDRGGKLSGGQRQRISIARAILKNPPILILDEATSALDTESERLVQEALTKLMENRTSIVIAHRLSTVKHADTIYVMQDGEIIEEGRHDELLEMEGVYKKLHLMQNY